MPGCKIQDVSTSISIRVRIQKNLNDLTERYDTDDDDDDDDESDKHLEARDRRYSCLIKFFAFYAFGCKFIKLALTA